MKKLVLLLIIPFLSFGQEPLYSFDMFQIDDIQKTQSGEYVLCGQGSPGQSIESLDGNPIGFPFGIPELKKIDCEGNTLWSTNEWLNSNELTHEIWSQLNISPSNYSWNTSFIEDFDGHYLMSASNLGGESTILMKINSNNGEIESYSFDNQYYSSEFSASQITKILKMTSDSNYIFKAVNYYDYVINVSEPDVSDAYIRSDLDGGNLDKNQNMWINGYGITNSTNHIDENNNLIISGNNEYVDSNNELQHDVLVYKVNEQGDIINNEANTWPINYTELLPLYSNAFVKQIISNQDGYLIFGFSYDLNRCFYIQIDENGNILDDGNFNILSDNFTVFNNDNNEYIIISADGDEVEILKSSNLPDFEIVYYENNYNSNFAVEVKFLEHENGFIMVYASYGYLFNWDFEEISYSCDGVSIDEESINKNLITTVDILGRYTNSKGFQLHIYDDGSVEKKYLIK